MVNEYLNNTVLDVYYKKLLFTGKFAPNNNCATTGNTNQPHRIPLPLSIVEARQPTAVSPQTSDDTLI